MLQLGFQAVEDALQVHLDDEIELGLVRVREHGAALAHDAREVGGAVEGAEAGHGFVEPGGDVGEGGDVDAFGEDLGVGRGFLDRGDGVGEGFFLHVGDGEGGAAGGEQVGEGEADAGCGAGDGDDFALEGSHGW